MNAPKLVRRTTYSKRKQTFSLEQFKINGSPVINMPPNPSQYRKKLQSYKEVSFSNNSVILLLTRSYISQSIINNRIDDLLTELQGAVDPKRFSFLPKQFQLYYQSETIKTILRLAFIRISECKGDIQTEEQLTKMINNYPFFRVCLVLWARTKAIRHLDVHRQDLYVLLGNQQEFLRDYEREVRFVPLEILCQSFGTKLTIQYFDQGLKQVYNDDLGSSSQMVLYIPLDELGTVFIQDCLIKDNQTNYSETALKDANWRRSKYCPSVQVFSNLSPRSTVPGRKECQKCGLKEKYCKCTVGSILYKPLKKGLFEHYISVLKTCKKCGNREIIYNDLCRKCETKKN